MKVTHVTTMTRKEMDILLWKWLLELGTGNSCKLHTDNVPVIWEKKQYMLIGDKYSPQRRQYSSLH